MNKKVHLGISIHPKVQCSLKMITLNVDIKDLNFTVAYQLNVVFVFFFYGGVLNYKIQVILDSTYMLKKLITKSCKSIIRW